MIRSTSTSSCCTPPLSLASFWVLGLIAVLGAAFTPTAEAANCAGTNLCGFNTCATPASGVPATLWGDLQPADTGVLPVQRDTSFFNQIGFFGNGNPYWMSVDTENGWVFAATNAGFEIWDARTNPASPTRITNEDFYATTPFWSNNFETKFYYHDLDAPPGKDDLVAVAGRDGVGLVVWNTTRKDEPRVLYQDHGATTAEKYGYEVYATTLGGQDYAFMAAENLNGGVFAYNLSAARQLTGQCIEAQPSQPNPACAGVFLRKIGTRTRASFIDGAGNFLAFSSGTSPRGFEIWNVANPNSPFQVLQGLSTEVVYGLAMWQESTNYYLALRVPSQLRIYNVSCIANNSCSSLGSPLATRAVNNASRNFVTFSRSNGVPFLYLGLEKVCAGPGLQDEWLYDVTNPSNPTDITPPAKLVNGVMTGYWGWYYPLNPTGYNFVYPRRAKFGGIHLYRAAHAIFDVHVRNTPTPPLVGSVSASPNPATVCQEVTFTAQNVTGQPPLTYGWQVLDGTNQVVATGGNVNPFPWTSPSTLPPGLYRGRVTVSNTFGSDDATSAAVTVQALPALAFTGPGQAPTADPFAGATVQFHVQEQGATQWTWDFGDGTIQTFTNPAEGRNPVHTYASVGTYFATVTIRNCVDTVGIVSNPLTVPVIQTAPLGIQEFAVQGCAFGFCSFVTTQQLTFTVQVSGDPDGYDYDWNGDGVYDQTSPTLLTNYTYPVAGTYKPVLRVRRASETRLFTHAEDIIISGPTITTAPAAPSNLGANATSSMAIQLTWNDNSNNELGFRIERRTTGSFTEVALMPRNTVNATLTGLMPDTAYEFRVRAVNGVGASAYSNIAGESTPPDVILTAPNNLQASASSPQQAALSWNDGNVGEDGFRIFRSEFDGPFTQVGSTGANQTSFNDNGLDPGTPYAYQVVAFAGSAQSGASNTATATTPETADVIFADDVEGSSPGAAPDAWSAVLTDGDDVLATGDAALFGNLGIEVCLDDLDRAFVEDVTPGGVDRYRARFHFDPNSLTVPEGRRVKILNLFQADPTGRLVTGTLRFVGDEYRVQMKVHRDDNVWVNSGFVTISDAPHTLEIDWVKSAAAGANNGRLRFWIDGELVSDLTGIDNDAREVDLVRLGVVGPPKEGTLGCIYMDQFESRESGYMGPFEP